MASSSSNLWVLLGLSVAGIVLMAKKLKRTIKEDFGAFVLKLQLLPPPQPLPPKAPHPLTGLTFAVSDVFDIEGHITGFGHPDWVRTHEPASHTSTFVSSLVNGGATCVGKTVVDEMAFSINGENKHYGTPTNPAVPERLPGGSSSGAAVAVAADLVDFSLCIDTVGGVRVPAAYCSIIGFRSSLGASPNTGVVSASTTLDSIGLCVKDPYILRRVGHVLLQLPRAIQRNPRQFIIADDCFQILKIPTHKILQVVTKSIEKLYGRQVLKHDNLNDYFSSKVPSLKSFNVKETNGKIRTSLKLLADVAQSLQRQEFKRNHGEWISSVNPVLEPLLLKQLMNESGMENVETENCKLIRQEMQMAMNSLLKDDAILVIPTVADLPPKLGSKELHSEEYRSRAFSLLSIATISGCCQVTFPLGNHKKCPLSVSLMARNGADRFLIDTFHSMYSTFQEQVKVFSMNKSSGNPMTPENLAEIAKEKGNRAFKGRQWQEAINLYTEAIKLNDTNATYYSNRAAAYLELRNYIQAESDCTKAIDLDKKNVKAYFRRGTAREMLGYYKESIEDFSYALVLEPTNKSASLAAERLRKLFQ